MRAVHERAAESLRLAREASAANRSFCLRRYCAGEVDGAGDTAGVGVGVGVFAGAPTLRKLPPPCGSSGGSTNVMPMPGT
jgi:hypothetical protein